MTGYQPSYLSYVDTRRKMDHLSRCLGNMDLLAFEVSSRYTFDKNFIYLLLGHAGRFLSLRTFEVNLNGRAIWGSCIFFVILVYLWYMWWWKWLLILSNRRNNTPSFNILIFRATDLIMQVWSMKGPVSRRVYQLMIHESRKHNHVTVINILFNWNAHSLSVWRKAHRWHHNRAHVIICIILISPTSRTTGIRAQDVWCC